MANNKQKRQYDNYIFDEDERNYYQQQLEAGTLSTDEIMFLEESGFFEVIEYPSDPAESFTFVGKALPPEIFNELVLKHLNGLTTEWEEQDLWKAIKLLVLKIGGQVFPSYIKVSDNRNSHTPTNKEDLVQDMLENVYRAFPKYDPEKASFSLYIRYPIINIGCMRISGGKDPHAYKRHKVLREKLNEISAQYGGLPNLYKLQALTAASTSDLEEVLNPMVIVSGDQAAGSDVSDDASRDSLLDMIAGPTSDNPINQVIRNETQNTVWNVLGMMDPIVQDIIMRTQVEGATMKDVAADLGISVEKATKLCQTGIRQFKQHPDIASYGGNKYMTLLGAFQQEGLSLAPSQVASELADELAPDGDEVFVLDAAAIPENNPRARSNTKESVKANKKKKLS